MKQRPTYEREGGLTLAKLWSQYLKKGWQYAVFLVVLWSSSIGTFFLPLNTTYNEAADARARLVLSFEAVSAASPDNPKKARQSHAKAILALHRNGLQSDLSAAGDTKERLKATKSRIERIAHTGEKLILDTKHRSWLDNPWAFIRVYLIVAACLLSIGVSIRYTFRTYVKAEYLADLPWKRGWPFLFAAFLPLLIPSFVVSAVRLRKFRQKGAPVEEPVEEETYDFRDNTEEARALFFKLRSSDWLDFVSSRQEAIAERLRELSVRAKAIQTERGQLMAEDRRLKNADVTMEAPDREELEAEFSRILAHPNIKGVAAGSRYLRVLVKARFTYEGVTYDLSDWELGVGVSGFWTTELRYGPKVKWHVFAHPVYRLNDGSFCFGSRRDTIDALLLDGKIAEAVLLAADCLSTINDDDLPLVPKAFKEATD